MNFRAAVSAPFTDIFQTRKYFQQGDSILNLGIKLKPESRLYYFEDYVLFYLLDRASGDFSPEMLMTDGLRKLRECSGAVDYWGTLRQYLENECNASETARIMFLHRSTLLTRLEHIRQWVELDDPDTRMYLRIMTRLLP